MVGCLPSSGVQSLSHCLGALVFAALCLPALEQAHLFLFEHCTPVHHEEHSHKRHDLLGLLHWTCHPCYFKILDRQNEVENKDLIQQVVGLWSGGTCCSPASLPASLPASNGHFVTAVKGSDSWIRHIMSFDRSLRERIGILCPPLSTTACVWVGGVDGVDVCAHVPLRSVFCVYVVFVSVCVSACLWACLCVSWDWVH